MGELKLKTKKYCQRLEQLKMSRSAIQGSQVLFFISGGSSFEHCELTRREKAFLESLKNYGYHVPPLNFPFNLGFQVADPVFPRLFKVALHNVTFFFSVRCHPPLRRQIVRHLTPLLECETCVIVSLSSGLNLLDVFFKEVSEVTNDIRIVALGPVLLKSWTHSQVKLTVVKGKEDLYTRLLDWNAADHAIHCKHLDYMKTKEVEQIVADILSENQS